MPDKKSPHWVAEVPEMRRIRHIHFVGIGGAGMFRQIPVLGLVQERRRT